MTVDGGALLAAGTFSHLQGTFLVKSGLVSFTGPSGFTNAPGATVQIQGAPDFTVANTFTNNGTIVLGNDGASVTAAILK